MESCKICQKELKNINGLAKHITNQHKDIDKETYYRTYINETSNVCECGNYKQFDTLGNGYQKYCSLECYVKFREPIRYWKDKKQPEEMIIKRIKNTDQKIKQQTRENTLLDRYNDSKYNNSKKISESNIGKIMKPRTKEHSDKIIQSKRNNNTLKHTEITKNKIREKIQEIYQSANPPVTVSENNGGRSKSGYVGNYFFRSSYEKIFIEYCISNDIMLRSAENKEFRVRYSSKDGKNHFYYPDFYLDDYNVVIEIKPKNLLNLFNNDIKLETARKTHNMKIVTEHELEDLEEFFKKLNRC